MFELDVREKISGSHKVLEDVPKVCQLCSLVDGSAYIELSVMYTFSRPMILGCMIRSIALNGPIRCRILT